MHLQPPFPTATTSELIVRLMLLCFSAGTAMVCVAGMPAATLECELGSALLRHIG
jgi:hypothetical protein